MNKDSLIQLSKQARIHILNMIFNAHSGHIGGAFSAIDIMIYLFFEKMNFNTENYTDNSRDRFILSKGHASAALYTCLAMKDFFPIEELNTFRKINSRLQGHPSRKYLKCIETSTGSLGQGLSFANGVAMGLKLDNIDADVYCLIGDGEINEGQIWEALMTSSKNNLDNLIAILDYNHLQIDGYIEKIKNPNPNKEKFLSFGFDVIEINGHDFDSIREGFNKIEKNNKPTMIIAHTIKGKGVSFMENNVAWHGTPPNEEEFKKALEELNA